jgi:hypothetical protein
MDNETKEKAKSIILWGLAIGGFVAGFLALGGVIGISCGCFG